MLGPAAAARGSARAASRWALSEEMSVGDCPDPIASVAPSPAARAVAYLAALLAAGLLVSILPAVLGGGELLRALAEGDVTRSAPFLLAASFLVATAFLAVTHLFLRRVDRQPWAWLLPPRRRGRDLATGALAGCGLVLLLMASLYLAGTLSLRGEGGAAGATAPLVWGGTTLAIVLLQSGAEEIACRGYLLRALAEWRGTGAALLASSMIFSLLHGLNPGTTPVALLNTALIGLLLGLIRLRRSLWTAIGFHAAWNYLIGFVLALPVSGIRWPGLLAVRVAGSPAWTGGDFGPEASLWLTGLLALAIVGMRVWRGDERACGRL